MQSHNINIIFSIFLFVYIQYTCALYEDQIGKFDWRRLHIGKVKEAVFNPNTHDEIFVVTEENVLASLSTRSELKWRQIFEKIPRGFIKLFHVISGADVNTVTTKNSNYDGFDILTVSGSAPAIIRGWSGATGNIVFEWSTMPIQNDRAQDAFWFYENYYLYHIIPVWNSHLEITKYIAISGHPYGHTSTKLSAPWITKTKCTLAESYFVCSDKNQLISLELIDDSEETKVYRKTLPFETDSIPKALKGRKGFVVIDNKLVPLKPDDKGCPQVEGSIIFTKIQNQEVYVSGEEYTGKDDNTLIVTVTNANSCEKMQNLQNKINFPKIYTKLEVLACRCDKNDGKCKILVSTVDGTLLFIEQDKIKFVREESLSNIVAAELIDLPLSDAEGAMETELNSKPEDIDNEWDIVDAFVRRMISQSIQLKNTALHLLGLGLKPTQHQKDGLVRDAFGLHKMLVILTKNGKLFGIDNLSGKIHWTKYLPSIENFNKHETMKLLIQRTSKHFPFEPVCIVIAKDKETGNGVLFQFNPISGETIENGLQKLDFKIKQFALLRENEYDFIKGLLLISHLNDVHVIPKNDTEKAIGMFLFTANKETATLEGYNVQQRNGELYQLPIWKVKLSGSSNNHKIVKIAAKNPNEHVHSQGRVLGDRSVLYKYINPNLVAVVTQALDNIHKYIMNVHLIDVVSGSVVFSMTHRKVKGPLHIVHSENWLVYSYYNDKVRRNEITTVELYEGKVQSNGTVWSSLDAPPLPLVERQSYIFPALIETMRETITERGITNKHVLIGLSSGGIVEMPWAFLDPRRPVSNQAREEGVIPYIPELPLPTENIINYNQSIARIKEIYTAPSGLESTCLVVAYGLDLFVTRVSPSKTFDLLKEDFDYFLISVVLLGLTVGSFVAKHLSSRKALKQAWK